MYVAIGKTKTIDTKDIIGIFDLDITSQSHLTRKFLASSEKSGQVVNEAEDIPKSFIVCCENAGRRLYLSQLSPSTLTKRIEFE